ncbi:MAG TPA: S8 family serine peptidase [Kofleriaceae bacterium]|nr:S8 family serine peptidase [Kofleriaceae bacterium]
MPTVRRVLLLLTCAVPLAACAPTSPGAPGADLSAAAQAKLPPGAFGALAGGDEQRLLLVIGDPAAVPATDGTDGTDGSTDDAHAEFTGGDGTALRWPDAKADLAQVANDGGLSIDDDWDQLPIIPVTARSLDELAPLLEDDRVVAVSPIQEFTTEDAESFPLINQPQAQAAGKQGAGTAVAVLDTGVDWARAPFTCAAPGSGACKVAYARDFAPDDGARDANGHGSNVAGIVIGVAPATRILALDVFNGGTASSDTILAAYNWVLQNRVAYHIAAVNLSLGGGRATSPCTTDALATAFQTGKNAGIVTAVAAGNDAAKDALSWPACAPAAVSVGAVYDANVGGLAYSNCSDAASAADKVACFSNTASFLTMLAPGALIDAAGYRMAGTSQATPHVAGAAAVLRASFPADSVTQLVGRMTSTGRAVVDARTNRTFRRLDLGAALGLARDTTPPTLTLTTSTTGSKVTLTWTATDPSGVAAFRLMGVLGSTVPVERCAAGSTLASGVGTGSTYTHGPLAPGATWSYRICATDALGNTTPGIAATVVVKP